MRLLLFTGNGGAGTTTIAAATAVHAARSGIKTLACSLDPGDADALADVAAVPVQDHPTEVEPGLSVVRLDPLSRGRSWWQSVQDRWPGLLDALGVDPPPAAELTVLPGVEELLALARLHALITGGPWDLVVVDCGPAERAIRLVALPEAVQRHLERALPVERRVQRALDRGARAGRSAGPNPPPDEVVEAADALHALLAAAAELLTAPTTCARLVLGPDAAGLARARRTTSALALHGVAVDAVVANRVVPGAGDDPWRTARAAGQNRVLEQAAQSFRPVPVRPVADVANGPVGVPALAGLGAGLYGPAGAASARDLLGPPAGEPGGEPGGVAGGVVRDGAGYELRLPLPFADRGEVGLARTGDHLVVELRGRRRVLALPSGLRRCTVVGARLVDGVLRVRFEPDPELWPL